MRLRQEGFKPALILTFFAALLAAGCGGGGGGGGAPSVTPTTAPQTQSAVQPVSIPNAGGAIPMPAVAGYAPTLNVPAGTSGNAQAQTFTVLPAGVPALSIGRHAESFSGNLFLLLSLTTTSPITFTSPPSMTIALPSGFVTSGLQFQLAVLTPGATAWQENLGPGTYNAATNTLTYVAGSGTYTLATGTTYLAFYTVPAPAPSPTPSASPTPTPTPTTAPTPTATPTPTTAPTPTATPTPAPVVVNPTSLSFTATGSSFAQSVMISESGYSGTFTPSSTTCSGIATTVAAPSANTFSVTPVAAGTCTETFTDSNNNSGTLSITVTTTTVGGS